MYRRSFLQLAIVGAGLTSLPDFVRLPSGVKVRASELDNWVRRIKISQPLSPNEYASVQRSPLAGKVDRHYSQALIGCAMPDDIPGLLAVTKSDPEEPTTYDFVSVDESFVDGGEGLVRFACLRIKHAVAMVEGNQPLKFRLESSSSVFGSVDPGKSPVQQSIDQFKGKSGQYAIRFDGDLFGKFDRLEESQDGQIVLHRFRGSLMPCFIDSAEVAVGNIQEIVNLDRVA